MLIDSGFHVDHVAFQHLDIVDQWDFIHNVSGTDNQPGESSSQNRHGTMVLSTIGGYDPGNIIGPAYGATYLLAKTEIVTQEIQAEEDNWVAAIERGERLGIGTSSNI